jgi:DNA repair protein Rad10
MNLRGVSAVLVLLVLLLHLDTPLQARAGNCTSCGAVLLQLHAGTTCCSQSTFSINTCTYIACVICTCNTCGCRVCCFFAPCRYHLLQPEYVLHRLAAVQRAYRLLVLLLLVDVEEVVKPLQELHRASMGADAVLICAWSNEVGVLLRHILRGIRWRSHAYLVWCGLQEWRMRCM